MNKLTLLMMRNLRSRPPMLAGDCSLLSLIYSVTARLCCHREGRSDLAFFGRAKQKERLPRCARLLVIARDKAISFFWGGQNKKRDCRIALAMTDVIARD